MLENSEERISNPKVTDREKALKNGERHKEASKNGKAALKAEVMSMRLLAKRMAAEAKSTAIPWPMMVDQNIAVELMSDKFAMISQENPKEQQMRVGIPNARTASIIVIVEVGVPSCSGGTISCRDFFNESDARIGILLLIKLPFLGLASSPGRHKE